MIRLAEKILLLILVLAVQAKAEEVRWKTIFSTEIYLSVSANISTVPEACRFRQKPQPVTISRCVAYMIQDHPKSAAFKATLLNIKFRNITLQSKEPYIKADLYFDTIRLERLYANIITQTSLSSVRRFVENNVNHDRAVRLAFDFTDMVHFDTLGDKVIGASGYVYLNGTAMTYLNEHADPHSGIFKDTFDLISTSFTANLPEDLVTAIKMIKPLECTFKWGRWFVFGPSYAFCEAAVHFDKDGLSNVDMRLLGFAEGGSLQRVLDGLFHSYTGDGFHQFATAELHSRNTTEVVVLRISGYVYHNHSRVHRIDLKKAIHGVNGNRLKASIKSSKK